MAFVEKVREQLAPDDTKSKEQLDLLKNAASNQLKIFRMEFKQKFDNPDAFNGEILPVKMFDFEEQYRVDIKESSSSEIGSIVDGFFKGTGGEIKEGFKNMIKLAFSSILGDSQIGESKIKKWFIAVEYGELIRVDLMSWRYNFSGNQIISNVQNAYCFTLTKSFIDNNSLSKSQLKYFLAKSLGLTNLDEIMENENLKKYVEYLQDSLDESKSNRLVESNYYARRWENNDPITEKGASKLEFIPEQNSIKSIEKDIEQTKSVEINRKR